MTMESVPHDIGRRRITDAITKAHRGHASGKGGEFPGGGMPEFLMASVPLPVIAPCFSRWTMQVGMSQGYAVNSVRHGWRGAAWISSHLYSLDPFNWSVARQLSW